MKKAPVRLENIRQAREAIQNSIQRTQLGYSRSCTNWLRTKTYLKFENQQTTGSFKIRGALNKVQALSKEEKKRGIVASSAGNHAQGVAFSASQLGIHATVVMPENSPIVKAKATKDYGAEVILHGVGYDECYDYAKQLEKEKGLTFVHPYEDPLIIAGQGTLGLEILEDLPDVDSVFVPIGGGGLISGVATAIKSLRPECKVYGVVTQAVPGMAHLFEGKSAEVLKPGSTIADGIAVKRPSSYIFDNFISQYVDGVVQVEEDEIAESIVFLMERAKTVVEGAAAVTLAAAAKTNLPLGEKTCMLLCGGNIDMNLIAKIIEHGLTQKGRVTRLEVVVNDRPGTLNELTKAIAEKKGNILEVVHDRLSLGLHLSETKIEFLLETRDNDHIQEIRKELESMGAKILGD